MTVGRIGVVIAVGLFAGFWVLRAVFADPEPESARQVATAPAEQEVQESEPEPPLSTLVEPSSGASSPWTLLQRMYGDIEGLCWEDVTSDRDAETEQIPLGFSESDSPPQDLVEYFEAQNHGYNEYQYKWISSMRVLLLRQVLVDTESGSQGPYASAVEVFRFRGANGNEFWETGDAATVYPCDAIR